MANHAEDTPKAEVLAAYVESLKMYERDNPQFDEEFSRLISTLPSPTKILKDFSIQECIVLFETVNYLWKKVVGKDIISENKLYDKPETLQGSYWMLSNGILLKGLNHYSIIKQNTNMFSTLLKLNGFALQEYLGSNPEEVIRYILENGGVRMFVNVDKEAFFQMSEQTYAEWGRNKVKKFEFKPKTIKVIDFKVPYRGWKSGVAIRF